MQWILAGAVFWYPAAITAATVVVPAVASSLSDDRLLEEDDQDIFVSYFSGTGSIHQLRALHCFYLSTGMNATQDADSVDNNWFRDVPQTVTNATDVDMSTYCNFTGVGCDRQGHVISLQLYDTGLIGNIPGCLADLDQLRYLILKGNHLTGPIPNSLSQLVHLSTLNLADNSLSGPLPDIWSNLTSLRRLRLDRNAFVGSIPDSFCQLSALVSLDLSANSQLTGGLPLCLANLTLLESLRITDIGLTGTIPPGLCSSDRAMNGFSPNLFGCSVIGCPAGTFREENGRKTNANVECTPCEVPSNVIATTRCQWVDDSIFDLDVRHTPSDSKQPSWMPTTMPSAPSPSPSPSKSPPSAAPTPSPVVTIVTTWEPALSPTAPAPSPSPSKSSPPSAAPTPSPVVTIVTTWEPSLSPTDPPLSIPNDDDSFNVDGLVVGPDVDHGDSPNPTPGILGGTLTASAFLIILMALLVWRRRIRYKELRAPEDISDKESESSGPDAEDIPTLPQQSLSTIEEENNSDVMAVGSGSTDSILKVPTVSSDPPSPPDLRQAGTGRRVRFNLPESIPWSTDDSDERGANETAQQPEHQNHRQQKQDAYDMNSIPRQHNSARINDAEAWASWILYPLFDTPGLCVIPDGAQVVSHDADEDMGSTPSHASSTTPMLPLHCSNNHQRTSSSSSSTDFYYCFDSSRQPRSMSMTRSSLRRSGPLLGIEDRIIDPEEDGIVLLERGYGDLTTTTMSRRNTTPARVLTQLEQEEGDPNPGELDRVSTIAVVDEGTYHLADDDDWAAAIGGMAEI